MAGPSIIEVGISAWVKVADAVQQGHIWIMDAEPEAFFQTWVDAGDPAPTDMSTARKIDGNHLPISSSRDIDVYMICQGVSGKIRVDV